MKIEERKKMVLAMEYITRHINDEDVFMSWLAGGVADDDIPSNSLNIDDVEDYYIEDDTLSYLMTQFLRLMASAKISGGLYCDRVCSKEEEV